MNKWSEILSYTTREASFTGLFSSGVLLVGVL